MVIQKDMASVYGLEALLASLGNNISVEVTDRKNDIEEVKGLIDNSNSGADTKIQDLSDKVDANKAITDQTKVDTDKAITDLTTVVTDNKKVSDDGISDLNDKVTLNKSDADGKIDKLQTSLDNMASNLDTDSLDSLTEIVDAFQAGDATLTQAIKDLADARTKIVDDLVAAQEQLDIDIKNSIKENKDTIEANNTTINDLIDAKTKEVTDLANTKLAIANNLSDLENIETARTNINVHSKEETYDLVKTNMATPVTEKLTVTGDDIVLTNAPYNGVILNFSIVRAYDAIGLVHDIPVMADADDPTKYKLLPNYDGQFDGKDVFIQYMTTPIVGA